MKEVANVVPTVYMCLGTNRAFYPHPTKVVVEWIKGGVESMGYWHPSDKDFLVPTLKYCAFILALIQHLPDFVSRHKDEKNYSWMWRFFAEPPKDCTEINEFWTKVTKKAVDILKNHSFTPQKPQMPLSPQKLSSVHQHSTPQKPSTPQKTFSPQKSSNPEEPSTPQKFSNPEGPSTPQKSSDPHAPQTSPSSENTKKSAISAESVRIYLAEKYGQELRDAYTKLKEAFNIVADKDFDLLLIFDEARYLTDTSAIDGKRIPTGVDHQELYGERELKASE